MTPPSTRHVFHSSTQQVFSASFLCSPSPCDVPQPNILGCDAMDRQGSLVEAYSELGHSFQQCPSIKPWQECSWVGNHLWSKNKSCPFKIICKWACMTMCYHALQNVRLTWIMHRCKNRENRKMYQIRWVISALVLVVCLKWVKINVCKCVDTQESFCKIVYTVPQFYSWHDGTAIQCPNLTRCRALINKCHVQILCYIFYVVPKPTNDLIYWPSGQTLSTSKIWKKSKCFQSNWCVFNCVSSKVE